MRLCFVTPTASRSGYGLLTALRGTAMALKSAGCDVWVVAGRDPYSEQDRALWAGVPVRAFDLVGPRAMGAAPGLRPWLAQQAPFDVISLHGVWAVMNMSAIRHARAAGTKTILTPQGMLDAWALARSRWRKRTVRILYVDQVLRAVDCFHVFSDREASALRDLGFRAPIAVIPNGVELPALEQTSNIASRSLRTLLFLGRLHVKKGIRELIEAWNAVGPEATHWRLVIAGPDELGILAELQRMTRASNVVFVGEVFGDEKSRWLRDADAFVLPSHSEGFPMAVLEAWSYGKPVVMTEECNIPEGFAVGAAFRVEPRSRSLEEGLRQLIRLPDEQLRSAGERGRELVENCYSWGRVAADLQEVYHWLRGNAARPDSVLLA